MLQEENSFLRYRIKKWDFYVKSNIQNHYSWNGKHSTFDQPETYAFGKLHYLICFQLKITAAAWDVSSFLEALGQYAKVRPTSESVTLSSNLVYRHVKFNKSNPY